MMYRRALLSLAAMSAAALLSPGAQAELIKVSTPLGSFTMQTREDAAPNTVANFLNYINDGDFVDSFFHRSAVANYAEDPQVDPPDIRPFVIQGGGFTVTEVNDELDIQQVPTDPPIPNEFGLSNVRGTVAMAKVGGDPDSATSGWFVNMNDNSENLDNQNGGFTVFAEVVAGMNVVDAIAALPRWDFGNDTFNTVPLTEDFDNTRPLQASDFVKTAFQVIDADVNQVLGDLNADGQLTNGDIAGFVQALTDPDAFAANNPGVDPAIVGDFSGDGALTNGDIAGFVSALTGSGAAVTAVPEPGAAVLLGLGSLMLVRPRRG